MNEITGSLTALAAGVLLGAFFFGGLLWTVHKCLSSRQAALWVLASLVLRTGVVLAGFHYVSAAHWERMLLCLLGFLIARLVATRLIGRTAPGEDPPLAHRLHPAHAVRASIAHALKGNRK